MKILVAVKRVVDYNVKVRVKSDNTGATEHLFMALHRQCLQELRLD